MTFGNGSYGRGVLGVCLWLMLAMGAAYGEVAGAAEESDAGAAKGRGRLTTVGESLAGLQSLQADVTTRWVWSQDGVTQTHAERVRYSLARPDRLAVRARTV